MGFSDRTIEPSGEIMTCSSQIRYASLIVTYRTRRALTIDQFPGSLWRGVLGAALKEVCCIKTRGACRTCEIFPSCLYAISFEPLPAKQGGESLPRPFVLHLDWKDSQGAWKQGETLGFGITVFSDFAWQRLLQLIAALIRMGEEGIGKQRVPLDLESVDIAAHDGGASRPIYAERRLSEIPAMIPWAPSLELPSSFSGLITVNLLSPFIGQRHGNHLSKGLPFQELIRNVLRRRHALAASFGDGGEEFTERLRDDARELIELAAHVRTASDETFWQPFGRYSARQRQAQSLSGLMGRVTYADVSPALIDPLLLGVLTHIGKQSAMAMGAYALSIGDRVWRPHFWEKHHDGS